MRNVNAVAICPRTGDVDRNNAEEPRKRVGGEGAHVAVDLRVPGTSCGRCWRRVLGDPER